MYCNPFRQLISIRIFDESRSVVQERAIARLFRQVKSNDAFVAPEGECFWVARFALFS
jgi:hypothetical protein